MLASVTVVSFYVRRRVAARLAPGLSVPPEVERQDEGVLRPRDVVGQRIEGSGPPDHAEGETVQRRRSAGAADADIDEATVAGDRDSQHHGACLGRGVADELLMLRKLLGHVPEVLIFLAPLAEGIGGIDEVRRLA